MKLAVDTSLFLLSTLCVEIFSRQGGRQHSEKWTGKHNVLHRVPIPNVKNAGRVCRGCELQWCTQPFKRVFFYPLIQGAINISATGPSHGYKAYLQLSWIISKS
uniref:Secreted protein n=1 Tax=Kryptolebias marmoratus TaxID=37003 RepID=A0A3Q3B8F0_KRYMA